MARRPRTGNPRLAVAYLRVSTEDQQLGPEAQRAAIEAWAQREGVEIVAWHADRGVSGGADVAARPALVAALGELRSVGAGVLLVAKRDRLARDVYIAGAIERAVAQCGARIVAADGTANGDTAADAFMRTILDGAAAYERALIRSRTRAALAAKRAKGERVGTVPYGYQAADGGRLAPNVVEQGVIEQARALRATGLTVRAVAAALAARGVLSRKGRPLGPAQIHAIVASA